MNSRTGASEKFPIIACQNLGGDYRKITLMHPCVEEHIQPGSCIILNGRPVALADSRKNRLIFIVKNGSFIFRESIFEAKFSKDYKFSTIGGNNASVISGGTGIAALLSLISERLKAGMTTKVFIIHRGFNEKLLVEEFPLLRRAFFWNSVNLGRPAEKYIDIQIQTNSDVFVAGPKSLFETVRNSTNKLGCNLFTNF